MSLKALFVVLVLAVVGWPGTGHAEKAKTNQPAKLYSRAGEQSPVLLKVQSGQTMTILARDGRWIKVRVSGRTGWIPRTKIDLPQDDEEITRNTRRRPFVDGRSTKRGFGGAGGPEDRVGADATGEGDDAKASKPAKGAKAGKAGKTDKTDKADEPDDDGDAEPKRTGKARKDDDKPAKATKPTKTSRASRAAKDADDDEQPAKPGRSRDDSDDDDRPAKVAKETKADADADDADSDTAKEPARPMAHVAKATSAYNEPSAKSDESFKAQPRTALYIVEQKGKWTFVENDEGDAGYVLTSKLDVDEPAAGGPRVRAIDLRGRFGFMILKQSISTPGGTRLPPDNYSAGSSSITIALGGAVLYPYARRYWLGGELAYDFNKAVPGIRYQEQDTGFTYHSLNLRAVAGYDLRIANGMTVFARLGFHYDSFQVADVADFKKNTAMLPNQIISAPTLGAALVIPRVTPTLGLKVSVDTILAAASVSQTKNLEDGTGPSAKAVFIGGALSYSWKPRLDLQLTYDLAYTSVSFSGPPPATSMRVHTGTGNSSGSDFNNTVSAGVAYGF